ncbi:maleylpyruvate isomerase N-terminal domain-containing protein [Amycolatopsis regifaucium]|uniref:Maleylpyruvate isomerase n=1 Tax=Amycolatopsis regifaucium TaxID=546365 RepID=A0A154MCZ8_9PSEU|nr:maleylpyruvate isomerase family mycothiol-dependent enzyme [Amycolatopsis regifaucium]KZB82130.1 maleylpyruvate isomerase [Amycolatopsis regifaucium]OKA05799.1 maleylpyruvate isomerase [Amycolatopsis regifaucium]SFG83534.1 maleylpyruvate isomerase [Amycolatopsis regifaucium]
MTATERAHALLNRVHALHDEWARVARGLDDETVRAPSALPGWTRAHLLSHLARNADGLVNLLTWAKSGVETPMYAGESARDSDIEQGAYRSAAEIAEDVVGSAARFVEVASGLPDGAWAVRVRARQGREIPAEFVLWLRLSETAIHLADLDLGYDFARVAELLADEFEIVVSNAIGMYGGELPSVLLVAAGADGTRHEWRMGTGMPVKLTGTPGEVLAWITGRSDGSTLDGVAPPLPHWL